MENDMVARIGSGACQTGVSMIIGMVALIGVDVVHDRVSSPNRVGFATSTCARPTNTDPLPPAIPTPTLISASDLSNIQRDYVLSFIELCE
jgi:hypothetical protein